MKRLGLASMVVLLWMGESQGAFVHGGRAVALTVRFEGRAPIRVGDTLSLPPAGGIRQASLSGDITVDFDGTPTVIGAVGSIQSSVRGGPNSGVPVGVVESRTSITDLSLFGGVLRIASLETRTQSTQFTTDPDFDLTDLRLNDVPVSMADLLQGFNDGIGAVVRNEGDGSESQTGTSGSSSTIVLEVDSEHTGVHVGCEIIIGFAESSFDDVEAVVPEPGSMTLGLIGLVSFGAMTWRKRRAAG